MGAWCDCSPIVPPVGEYRTELTRFVIEFTKTVTKPLGPDVAPLLVSMFDVTIARGLASGLSWADGEAFLLRHIRQTARRAEALSIEDDGETITAFDVNQAFNEMLEKARGAERRLAQRDRLKE